MLLRSRGLKIKAFGEEKCYRHDRLGNVSLISLRQSGMVYRYRECSIATYNEFRIQHFGRLDSDHRGRAAEDGPNHLLELGSS